MSKKVVLISASARIRGNSDMLCDEFMRGVIDSGHSAEKITLHQKNYKGCLGCGVCKTNGGTCIQKDDCFRNTCLFLFYERTVKTFSRQDISDVSSIKRKRFLLYYIGRSTDKGIYVDYYRQFTRIFKLYSKC